MKAALQALGCGFSEFQVWIFGKSALCFFNVTPLLSIYYVIFGSLSLQMACFWFPAREF